MICDSGIWKNIQTTGRKAKQLQRLEENLKEIHDELNSDNIPSVRRVAKLEVA